MTSAEHWKKRRIEAAPKIEKLCKEFKTDFQIGEALGLHESHVHKVRKEFGIVSGIEQERTIRHNKLIELWNQQADWHWVRGRMGMSDSGFKRLALKLHEEGKIKVPAHYLVKRKPGFSMPGFDPKHQENAVKNARINHHKRIKRPEFWEKLINNTPEWIRPYCEQAKQERLMRGAA